MKKIIKNAVILTLITVIAGAALGVVYEVTKDPIAAAKEAEKQNAYKAVLTDATSFEEYAEFDADEASQLMEDSGLSGNVVNEVAVAKDDSGEVIGYVITVTNKESYGGEIQISTGIDVNGTVKGISILSISETAGLGMKATEADFMDQFKDKAVSQFEYTKSGASADNQIDAISGATITTNAVTQNVNSALVYYQNVLGGGNTNE